MLIWRGRGCYGARRRCAAHVPRRRRACVRAQGTSLAQDFRYKDKAVKQLAEIDKKAPPEFKQTVGANVGGGAGA